MHVTSLLSMIWYDGKKIKDKVINLLVLYPWVRYSSSCLIYSKG